MERKSSISSLKFVNYIVKEVNYKINNIESEKNSWKMNFDVSNKTIINKEKDKMEINLAVEIFKGVEDAPFYMNVEIIGIFELVEDLDISKYEANAIAIMYPYLRAIVSTYTASSNVLPIILPAINVNAMLKNKNNTK